MAITGNEPTAYLELFDTVFMDELQDKGSRLLGIVMEDSLAAKRKFYHKIGKKSVTEKTSRLQKVELQTSAFERRPLTDVTYGFNEAVDKDDIMEMIVDPTSAIIKNALAAHARQLDTAIMNKILGTQTVITKDEDETESSSSVSVTNSIAAAADVYGSGATDRGLDRTKLLKGRELILEAYGAEDFDKIFVIGNIAQLQRLLNDDEIVNSRYRSKQPYEGAGVISDLSGFLGMEFIHYEGIPADGNGDDQVIMIAEGALIKGTNSDITTQIEKSTEFRQFPNIIDIHASYGIARTYEEKIVKISCDPTL